MFTTFHSSKRSFDMCFSAGASFGASAVVATAGVLSVKRVSHRNQIMFACIPFIFALQQFVEGLVWITFTQEEYGHLRSIPVMGFLIIAQVIWPVWVPLSILKTETERRRIIALKVLFAISCVVAPLQAYRLFFYSNTAEMTSHHIHYALDFSVPYFGLVLNVFYFMSTIFPPFLSKQKTIIALGIFNITSFILTVIFFEQNVVSVWCFFAALISWQVVKAMKNLAAIPRLGMPVS